MFTIGMQSCLTATLRWAYYFQAIIRRWFTDLTLRSSDASGVSIENSRYIGCIVGSRNQTTATTEANSLVTSMLWLKTPSYIGALTVTGFHWCPLHTLTIDSKTYFAVINVSVFNAWQSHCKTVVIGRPNRCNLTGNAYLFNTAVILGDHSSQIDDQVVHIIVALQRPVILESQGCPAICRWIVINGDTLFLNCDLIVLYFTIRCATGRFQPGLAR